MANADKPPGKSGWDIVQILIAAASPIVLAVLAYFLTGKITLALQERQVNLAAGKEIQGLMIDVMTATDPKKATAAAVGLAAYGDIAVPPLTYLLRSGDDARLAAVEGLRAAATTHPKAVCAAMKTIIENRTQIYSWENHQTAIELIGQLQCEHGREWLESYDKELGAGGQAGLARRVSQFPEPNRAAFDNLRAAVQNALKSFP
ncbi:MAG TPA: hypothetical protein VEO74_12865 [Thermoanaerobaculia bacterium]|nr:hypothetical protein [Thermoanaerobaculia bacterium]